MTIAIERTLEMAALFMIGDGLLGLTQPDRHVALWRSSMPAIDAMVRPFDGRPGRRRAYGLAQFAAGLMLASRLRAGRARGAARRPPHAPFDHSKASSGMIGDPRRA